MGGLRSIRNDYLSLEAWKKWYLQFVIDSPAPYDERMYNEKVKKEKKEVPTVTFPELQNVAIEVLNFRKEVTNFAGEKKYPPESCLNSYSFILFLFISKFRIFADTNDSSRKC